MTTPLKKKENNMHALITNQVFNNINVLKEQNKIAFLQNYNVANAIQSAYLTIKETKTTEGKSVLTSCTQESIIQSIMNMILQGLNPAKNQCYFIAYGNKLTMIRSYFGSIAVAKSLNPDIEDIFVDVVYKDDIFEYSKKRGKTIVDKHVQKFANIDKNKIIGAYATVYFKDDTEWSEIMTYAQILECWKKSTKKLFNDKGVLNQNTDHAKFTEEFCKRTVANRACKLLINITDDTEIMKAIRLSEEEIRISDAKAISESNLNKEFIDIEIEEQEEVSKDKYVGELEETIEEPVIEEEKIMVDIDTGEVINLQPEELF